jgi:hypothetical protein
MPRVFLCLTLSIPSGSSGPETGQLWLLRVRKRPEASHLKRLLRHPLRPPPDSLPLHRVIPSGWRRGGLHAPHNASKQVPRQMRIWPVPAAIGLHRLGVAAHSARSSNKSNPSTAQLKPNRDTRCGIISGLIAEWPQTAFAKITLRCVPAADGPGRRSSPLQSIASAIALSRPPPTPRSAPDADPRSDPPHPQSPPKSLPNPA